MSQLGCFLVVAELNHKSQLQSGQETLGSWLGTPTCLRPASSRMDQHALWLGQLISLPIVSHMCCAKYVFMIITEKRESKSREGFKRASPNVLEPLKSVLVSHCLTSYWLKKDIWPGQESGRKGTTKLWCKNRMWIQDAINRSH